MYIPAKNDNKTKRTNLYELSGYFVAFPHFFLQIAPCRYNFTVQPKWLRVVNTC